MKQRALLFALVVVGLAGFSGCATVQPWERATLADYTMSADRDPLAAEMSEHIFTSREASSGGRGVDRNGCGCN